MENETESIFIHPKIAEKINNSINGYEKGTNQLATLLRVMIESIGKIAKTTDEHYDALIEMNKKVNKLMERIS